MALFLDRKNMVYGRLTVVSHAGKNKRGRHLWNCLCSCGTSKVVVGDNLSSKRSKSCGCLLKEFLLRRGNQYGLYEDREEAILKVQYSHMKRRNTKKNFKNKVLSFEEYKKKVKQQCFYCGVKYSRTIEDRLNESKKEKRLSDIIVKMNGLDRINPKQGYTSENTTPCCGKCNFAKNSMTKKEFYEWIRRVYAKIPFSKGRRRE